MATEKKTNSRKTKNKAKEVPTFITFDIDYDKLAEAIVKAEIKAKEIEDDKKKNEQIEERSFKEKFKLFWKLMIIRKKEIINDSMTFAFLKAFIEMILLFAELFLCFVGIVSVISPVLVKLWNINASAISIAILMVYGVFMIIFSRFLRVSRFEIDKLSDRDYLNTIVGSFMAIIGTIVAIIGLVRGVA